MKDHYTVTARRWARGWELHIPDEGVTQVRTLGSAVDQVRDYLASLHDADADYVEVDIVAELGDLSARAAAAREATAEAAEAQRRAAAETRAAVAELRANGLSVSDIAVVMGVTRGRVSQIAKAATREHAATA
jgi:DNA-directed RNA polymerase specialized sigma24 family protein